MFVIQRGKPKAQYYTYDGTGQPAWTMDVLNAARFESADDAKLIDAGTVKIVRVGYHGHEELYRAYLFQIYREGYHRWRVRLQIGDTYRVLKKGAGSANAAIRLGRDSIDEFLSRIGEAAPEDVLAAMRA